MSHPLQGARIKLGRAERHFDELKVAIVSMLQPNPERLEGQYESDRGEWVYRVPRSPTTRAEWSAILGDTLNNLRSALDYIVAELVIRGEGVVTGETAFPIIDRQAKYLDASRRRIAGVVLGSEVEIESLQPYHAGNDAKKHPLAMLRDLNNWDKHQAIHTTAQIARGRLPTAGYGYRGTLGTARIFAGPFKRGGIVAAMQFAPLPGKEPYVDRELEVTYDVAFQDGPAAGQSVVGAIERITSFVAEEALPPFDQFF